MINNYNTNSKGADIETNVCYDSDYGRIAFEDNFTQLDCGNWLYTDNGNIGGSELEWQLREDLTNKEILLALYKFSQEMYLKDFECNYYDNMHWRELTRDHLLQIFLEIKEYDGYIDNEAYEECDCFVPNFETTAVIGYSQGDYVEVIVLHKTLDEYSMGREKALALIQEQCNHLFHDAPINGTLTIDETEFFITEYLNDTYEWDKDKFVANFFEANEVYVYAKEELVALLPDELDYI